MSSTANHKKAIEIFREASKKKRCLMDIFLKIMEDCPSAIVNAWEALAKPEIFGYDTGKGRFVYKCKDCLEAVEAVGIAGACITCDPRGFDVPY